MGEQVATVNKVGRLRKNPNIVVMTFAQNSHAIAFRRQFHKWVLLLGNRVSNALVSVVYLRGRNPGLSPNCPGFNPTTVYYKVCIFDPGRWEIAERLRSTSNRMLRVFNDYDLEIDALIN